METNIFRKAESKRNEIKNCENTIKELQSGDYLQAFGRMYGCEDQELVQVLIKFHENKLVKLKEEFKTI